MSTSPTDPNSVFDMNRHALLEEGARSYLQALTALTIFRKDVQAVCRQAIESRLPEFLQALGVSKVKAEPIVSCATQEDKFNGSSAYLGVKHKISRRKQSLQRLTCTLYCGLSWEPVGQKPWFGCFVSMWFNRQEDVERLHARFRGSKVKLPSGIDLNSKGNEVWVSRALKPEDMASLRDRLDEVMVEWIRLWTEFGGLKALALEQT